MPPLKLIGMVTKAGFMDKTVTVTVSRWKVHSKTMKRMEVCKKYLTHDPENILRKDDKVVIQNCPPISARKRFALHKILRSPEGELEAKHAKEAQQQQEKGTRSTAS